MYELAVAITGQKTVPQEAIDALLDDYFSTERGVIIVISNEDYDALEDVDDWIGRHDGIPWIESDDDGLLLTLLREDAEEYGLIVLGIEGSEDIIEAALATTEENIIVSDLSQALITVTGDHVAQVRLDSAEKAAKARTENLQPITLDTESGSQRGVQSRTEDDPLDVFLPSKTWTRKEIEEIVEAKLAGILTSEPNRRLPETVLELWNPETGRRIVHDSSAKAEEEEQKFRCLKKPDGSIVKAPRAKPKPGDEEVWLTQEELNAL